MTTLPQIRIKVVEIGFKSRFRVWLLRVFFKPLMSRMIGKSSKARIVALQVKAAGVHEEQCCGMAVHFRIVNNVPGSMVGDLETRGKPVVLYLHGGAFMFPASPQLQLTLLARLCRDLDAVGFMPAYRLTPQHCAPAALEDCERAHRGLLDLGYPPHRIVVVGESAGGNLVLGLLQRIRKAGLPQPACAVPISPVTDLVSVHALPSRRRNADRDALVSPAGMYRINRWYVGANDPYDPEISPLYADYSGFPPLYFLAAETEILLDDSVLAAERAREAGVDVRLDVWPVLPHAFPIFEDRFVEAREARADIVAFVQGHLTRPKEAS